MKKQLLTFFLACSLWTSPQKLNHPLLTTADNAGVFDKPIVEILKVRQKIKDLLTGKFKWEGYSLSFETTSQKKIATIFKKIESIFGISYIVIAPNHPDLKHFIKQDESTIQNFAKTSNAKSVAEKLQHPHYDGFFTGSYALHPITHEKLPIFIADYAPEFFDIRHTHTHFAVPAHDPKDFSFAQKHKLPIPLVITGNAADLPEDMPQLNGKKELTKEYTRNDDDCMIIHSDFINGPIKEAREKIATYIKNHNIGSEYKETIVYTLHDKQYSIENLNTIETTLEQEHKQLSASQKEELATLLRYAQSDFLDIVDQFLEMIKSTRKLMIDLIEESCVARNNSDSFLLKWSKAKPTNDSERTVFQREIITFKDLSGFLTDLSNFLGDFASSCPHALENLRNLKNK